MREKWQLKKSICKSIKKSKTRKKVLHNHESDKMKTIKECKQWLNQLTRGWKYAVCNALLSDAKMEKE